jgi:hypothetical protein
VASSFVSLDPGGWFHEEDFCAGAQTSAAAVAVPAVVKVAKDQGAWLRRLAGPPPDPADTVAAAERAADAVVASTLAFRASLQGKRDPAAVVAYTAAHRERAEVEARTVGACDPVCPTTTDPGGKTLTVGLSVGNLDAEQARNAATIVAVGKARRVPARGQVVAVAVALQESGLRNLDHGDRDSVGVFQQRASWGPVGERMDVAVAAGKFYAALGRVPGWDGLPVTEAAQAVQRSAFPSAYAKWEGQASTIVTGTSGVAQVASCTPGAVFKAGAAAGGWGGHVNGRIPPGELAAPGFAPRHRFRPDAAQALQSLAVAYRARFGSVLGVTDSYRDYAGQVSCTARKGSLCARPGTSNHGWGLAVDLVVGGYGDARYRWLVENAPRFGWDNPGWARAGGSKPEPWHWEFNPTGARA